MLKDTIWLEFRAGNLTRAHRDVLLCLAGYGRVAWPSHQTLADRANCCVRTVQRALEAARDLGLVTWVERRVRAGWRWLRTSNRYTLTVPATTGQKVWRENRKEKRRLTNTPLVRVAPLIQAPIRTPKEQIEILLRG
jgi:DNA-binding transcriptional MocR family regulator